jgi:hypothetical protein
LKNKETIECYSTDIFVATENVMIIKVFNKIKQRNTKGVREESLHLTGGLAQVGV